MNLISFLPEQLFILIAAIYVLGIILKKTEKIVDNYIPLILVVFAIIFSVSIQEFTPHAILQGILCWGVSVGINQTTKQLTKEV